MIIGITGRAGSGKDTVADILVREHGYAKIAFADPIKKCAMDWFGWDEAVLWGPSKLRDIPDRRYVLDEELVEAVIEHEKAALRAHMADDLESARQHEGLAAGYAKHAWLTPRRALQRIGTEVGRQLYMNVWADIAIRTAQRALKGDCVYVPWVGFRPRIVGDDCIVKGVVISDVRFPNEVTVLRAVGATLWRTTHGKRLVGDTHESERYINDLEVDMEFPPHAALEELPAMVVWGLENAHRARVSARAFKIVEGR